jgi:hypothetical protein
MVRYHSKGCGQEGDVRPQDDKSSWWSISCEEESGPSSEMSSEIGKRLSELRIKHCNRLRQFCEQRELLKSQACPEKKHRSLRKRLSSTVRSLSRFRDQSSAIKLSAQRAKPCIRKNGSNSSSLRVSYLVAGKFFGSMFPLKILLFCVESSQLCP